METYFVDETGVYQDVYFAKCIRCGKKHYKFEDMDDTKCAGCGGATEGWFTERVLVQFTMPGSEL